VRKLIQRDVEEIDNFSSVCLEGVAILKVVEGLFESCRRVRDNFVVNCHEVMQERDCCRKA